VRDEIECRRTWTFSFLSGDFDMTRFMWLSMGMLILVSSALATNVLAYDNMSPIASGNWEDAANWTSGTVPDVNSNTIWLSDPKVTFGASAGDRMVGAIELNGSIPAATAELYFAPDAGTLTDVGYSLIAWGGHFSGNTYGKLTMDGGTFTVQGVAGLSYLWDGRSYDSVSVATINTGATWNTVGGTIGYNGLYLGNNTAGLDTGSATLNLNGGTLNTIGITFADYGAKVINIGNGGKINFIASGSIGTNGNINILTGGAILSTASAVDQTINTIIAGTGSVTVDGAGTLTLTAANTYSGDTKVNAGTLILNNNLALQNSVFDTSGAGTLTLAAGVDTPTFGGLASAANFTVPANVTTLTLNPVAGTTATYSGDLVGSANMNLIKSGPGTQVFAGTDSSISQTTINAGTLQAAKTAALPGYDSAGLIVVNDGGTLAVNAGGAGEWDVPQIGTVLSNVTFNAGSALGIDTTSGEFSYEGSIGGIQGLTKLGANGLILTTNQSYTGPTIVNAGTLALRGENMFYGRLSSTSGVVINNGGTVAVQDNNALGGYETSVPTVTLNPGGVLTTSGGITSNLKDVVLQGGELASSVPNDLWGSWALIGSVQATGNGVTSTISAQEVVLYQTYATPSFTVDEGATLNVTGTFRHSTLNGTYFGGALIKNGLGKMVLNAPQTYVGGTVEVNAGTLEIRGINAEKSTLSDSAGIVINNGGTVDVEAFNSLGGTMTSVPTVTINPGGKLTMGNGQTCTLNALELQGGELAAGPSTSEWGSWALFGDVHVGGSGVTSTISASDVVPYENATGGHGMRKFTVDDGATLNFTGTLKSRNVYGWYTSFVKDGPGTMILAGQSVNYTDAMTVQAGTLELAIVAQAPVLTGAGGADIQGGKMVFDYTGPGDNPASTIAGLLAAGYNGGTWATGQIRNTTAGTTGLSLGWADSTTADYVTVMATYAGDANLSGKVDVADLTLLLNNYNKTDEGWANGDFNYDGSVNVADLTALLNNYNKSIGGSVAAIVGSTAVPEPGTLALLAAGLLGLLVYAWRKRK
jgi:fibronectin-binding autotransporter adhesin